MISSASAIQSLNNKWTRTAESVANVAAGTQLKLLTENPSAYAASLADQVQASAQTAAQPGLSLVSGSLSAGVSALSSVNNVLEAMRGVAQAALSNPSDRSNLQSQYNTLAGQLDSLVNYAGVNGVNLVSANAGTVTLNTGGSANSSLTVSGASSTAQSLGISSVNWTSSASIQSTIGKIDQAMGTVQSTMGNFGAQMAGVSMASTNNASNILANQANAADLSQTDYASEAVRQASLSTGRAFATYATEAYVRSERAILQMFQ